MARVINGAWPGGAAVIRRAAAMVGVDRTALPLPVSDGGPFEQIETEIGPLWIQTGDEVMRPYLMRRKAWNESIGALLEKLLSPGARFLDVGAHVGYFSLFAHSLGRDVLIDAVEPHPILHNLLAANLWANKVVARVHNTALGDSHRLAPMSSASMNSGDSRVGIGTPEARYDLVVPMITADELFARRGFDLVKIDVQGFEPEVVLGMERIVRQSPGIVLVCQFWPTALGDRGLDPGEVLDGYRRLGFHIAVNDPEGTGTCSADEVLEHCRSAGPDGQVNLILTRDT
jgi:FkbM family methyltransferase